MPTNKFSLLLFIIISSSLIQTSCAGRQSKFLTENSAEEFVGVYKASPLKRDDNKEDFIIHERMLKKMNTQDYGRFDTPPSLPKPRHKLIPN